MHPKVIQTVTEMLIDRGYKDHTKLDEFIIAHKGNETLKVYFITSAKVGIKQINDIIKDIEENEINKAIVVHSGSLSSFGKQAIQDTNNIEIFNAENLYFNITHHHLVPKHEIVSNETKKELLKIYRIQEQNLPQIKVTDPVSMYYGAKQGQLFKITRSNEYDGSSITYRLCVNV